MYKGVDVSEFQGVINWKKASSEIDFAIVRAGYDGYVDPYWKQNVNNAKANGLHVGAYWFMYFLNEEEAIRNADEFINQLRKFDTYIDMPVALDVEEDTYRYMKQMGVEPTKELITKLVNIFCKRVEDAGYYTMIYSNLNGFRNYMGDVSKYDVWLAQTEVNEPSKHCGIWQYSFHGYVDGISGKVDMDIAYHNYPKIIRDAGLNHLGDIKDVPEKPKEVQTKIKVGDIVKVIKPIIYGTNKRFNLWYENYNVIEVAGDRAVIGKGKAITAPIDVKYLRKV